MSHEYTQVLDTRMYEVKISPSTLYGYFEHKVLGDARGGGLWFARVADGGSPHVQLVDFDGTTELPKQVATALRGAGYHLDETFD